MQKSLVNTFVVAALAAPFTVQAAESTDMAEVKRMIEQMKADYEEQIQALEKRLETAEQKVETTTSSTLDSERKATDATGRNDRGRMGAVTSGSAFNPQISVILDGNYYRDSTDGEGTELLGMADGISHVHAGGHDHDDGHSHGGAEQGFNFRSAEIAFSASVDSYFDATALLAVDGDGSVELEEAWFQTRSLPYGFKIKAGKFFSDIGYVNNQHPHNWDFTDQNLAYLNLLGDHGLADTGAQVTWLPDWDHYTLFGLEVFQGEQEKLGASAEIDEHLEEELDEIGLSADDLGLSDEKDGPRLVTAFVKYAPDLGYDHALQLGAWGAWANQHQEIHGEPLASLPAGDGETPLHALEGDAWMWGLDAVYKYDGSGAYGKGDFKLQGEYIWQQKDLELTYHQANPSAVGAERKFTEDGLYLQGLYGIAPRWQAGLRYDVVGLTNKLESDGAKLRDWDESDRWTAALTWTPTEYSQFRLQYSKADITVDGESNDFDYVYLQYILSLGSHGAHRF